jgi:pyruvate dehydrogenase E1 component alpha subunit
LVAVFFGDGATSSNDFHAGMTFAGVWKAPVLFLCRNNGWAISVPSDKQTAAAVLADKAVGYGMRALRADGNDVLAVYETVKAARAHALSGKGPVFVELLTYRMSGHSTSDDPKVYRDDEEVEGFRANDPITRLRAHLVATGALTEAADADQRTRLESEIRETLARAEKKGAPALPTVFSEVFETQTPRLRSQEESLLRGPRARTGHK